MVKIEKAKNIMETMISEKLKVHDLARMVYMSESEFARMFKRTTEISPYKFHLQQRLKLATILLKESNLPITNIAHDTGFSEISSFSRSFKQYYKISPTSFKKQLQKQLSM